MEMTRPRTTPLFDLFQYAASNILFMPSGIHQDSLGVGLQASTESRQRTNPNVLPDGLAVGVSMANSQIPA